MNDFVHQANLYTRHAIDPPISKTETYKHSFFPSNVRLWNSLKSAKALGYFKSVKYELFITVRILNIISISGV